MRDVSDLCGLELRTSHTHTPVAIRMGRKLKGLKRDNDTAMSGIRGLMRELESSSRSQRDETDPISSIRSLSP